jgi:hypothetical protein
MQINKNKHLFLPFETSKHTMKIIKYIIPFLIISIVTISCGDDICISETESFLSLEFNITDTTLTNKKYLENLSVYSPEWSDSIHYSEEGRSSILNFQLSPHNSNTQIVITSDSSVLKDTIRFYHQNELFFLSPECGFILNYKIDSFSVTSNLIDSIHLTNDEITTDINGLFEIYML